MMQDFYLKYLPLHYCKLCFIPNRKLICSSCYNSLQKTVNVLNIKDKYYDNIYCKIAYGKPLSKMLHLWKYRKIKYLAWPLSYILYLNLPKELNVDVIIPMPLHINKEKSREFNQANLLLKYYCLKDNSIKIDNTLATKVKDTSSQVLAKNIMQRQGNVSNVFIVNKDVTNLKILIIDDVITSGTTANELAKALKLNGALEVSICSLMRLLLFLYCIYSIFVLLVGCSLLLVGCSLLFV